MKIRTIAFSLSVFTIFAQAVTASSVATNKLPDEMVLEIFSYLKPEEVGKASGVSKQFNRLACDKDSPLSKLKERKEDYKGIINFCKFWHKESDIKEYAERVAKLQSNPFPDLISEETFKKAKSSATFFYYNRRF